MLEVSQTLHVLDNIRSFKQQSSSTSSNQTRSQFTPYLKLIIISKASLISITLQWSINHKAPMPRKDIWNVQILLLIAFFWKLKNELIPREVTEYIWINPKSPLSVTAQLTVHPHICVKIKQTKKTNKISAASKNYCILNLLKCRAFLKIKLRWFPYQFFHD